MENKYDVLVLGAGPAGLTAGMYLARARQRVLILDTASVGGQVIFTHAVANYPGVGEVPGYKLVGEMKRQAVEFGCEVKGNQKLLSIDIGSKTKRVSTTKGEYEAGAVIIASGGKPRSLGIESEQRFQGQGVSYCATCDGDFFTGQDIVVVGGGNSALEEAVALTRYASHVTLVHQFDHFQGYAHAIREVEEHERITVLMETVVEAFRGEASLTEVEVRNVRDGSTSVIPATGAFIFIGYIPETTLFKGILDLSERQEIITDADLATGIPGVFAAGDVRNKKVRQITTAVSDGTIAALSALEYLNGADPCT